MLRSTRLRALPLCVALLATTSAHVFAATVDDKGAQDLKAKIQAQIDLQKKTALNPDGSQALKTEGELKVEPKDSYYAVTYPSMSVAMPDGGQFKIGVITSNVAPTDDPQVWKFSTAVPSPMAIYDAQNKPILGIQIGKQKTSGLWHDSSRTLTNMSAEYGDILIRSYTGRVDITAESATFKVDYTKGADGLWSGPAVFALNNLAVKDEAKKVDFTMRRFALEGAGRGMSLDAYADFAEKAEALAESGPGQDANPQQILGMYNLFSDFIGKAVDGMDMAYKVEGIDLKAHTNEGGQPATVTYQLADGHLGFGMDGLTKEKGTMRISYGFNGMKLAMDPPPPGMADVMPYIPDSLSINLQADNIPVKQLLESGRQAVQGAADPQMAPMAGMLFMTSLPQMLSQSGTTLTISDTKANSAAYTIDIVGKLLADASAMNGATGDVTGKIVGLDEILAKLNADAQSKAGTPDAANIQQAIMGLTSLQMFGQQGTDPSGKSSREYKFVLTKDGKVTLNGADLSALMGGGGAVPAQAPGQMPEGQTLQTP